ncbi:MAG: hypothetical protein RJA70_4679 [Pseudomonadota bacterium]|jgi:hypothetical protein
MNPIDLVNSLQDAFTLTTLRLGDGPCVFANSLLSALPAPLEKLLFVPWQGKAFERANWEGFMYVFSLALSLLTALLFLAKQFASHAGFRVPKKWVLGVSLSLTIVGFFSYFSFFNPNTRYTLYYHRHEVFHYYLGSKYFDELGYGRLYECTAVAEVELGHGATLKTEEIRDLRAANLIRPMTSTYVFDDPAQCTSHFEKVRWEAFKQDVKWLRESAGGSYWTNMKKDHGYNPPPVWTMFGKLWSQIGPASDATFKQLAALDVGIHVGILALFAWAFGWPVAALASVFWATNTAGNFYWTGGAFLRHDWIFLLVASICLAKKRYFGLSGAALTWSALLRVFPAIAGFGWAAMILIYWLKHRRFHPDHKRFVVGAALAAVVLVPSSLYVAGPDSYKEFAGHIALHKNTPLTNHMGLEVMLAHDWNDRMRFSRDDSLDDPFQTWKEQRLDAPKPLKYAIWLLLMAAIVWSVRKTRHFWIAAPLSIGLVMSMTNLTCYYFVIFIAFAPLAKMRPSLAPALLATAAGSQVLLRHYYWIDDRYAALSYLFFAFALLPLIAFSRPPTLERVGSWLRSLRPSARRS